MASSWRSDRLRSVAFHESGDWHLCGRGCRADLGGGEISEPATGIGAKSGNGSSSWLPDGGGRPPAATPLPGTAAPATETVGAATAIGAKGAKGAAAEGSDAKPQVWAQLSRSAASSSLAQAPAGQHAQPERATTSEALALRSTRDKSGDSFPAESWHSTMAKQQARQPSQSSSLPSLKVLIVRLTTTAKRNPAPPARRRPHRRRLFPQPLLRLPPMGREVFEPRSPRLRPRRNQRD